MRTEPVELHLSKSCLLSESSRANRNGKLRSTRSCNPRAVDEAFAAFDGKRTWTRVDRGGTFQHESSSQDCGQMERVEIVRQSQAMVANVVTHLEMLDRQRRQLARLLEEIGTEDLAQN